MSHHSFSDLTQFQWIRACQKLGLKVDTRLGKGSHVRITHPHTGNKYTIQCHLHKFINMKIFKKMLEWEFTEEEIWKALN